MDRLQTQDPFIQTIFKTQFFNDTNKFFEKVKTLFTIESKLKSQEYRLLKAYEDGTLSIGQIGKILDLDKLEVMNLLEEYDIGFIEVDEEYLEQEFNAFKNGKL